VAKATVKRRCSLPWRSFVIGTNSRQFSSIILGVSMLKRCTQAS